MPVIPIRPVRISGNIAYIPLTLGKEAIIDANDVPIVDAWNWFAVPKSCGFYVQRSVRVNGKSKTIWLHREIMSAPSDRVVDHINGDALDNRRCNLRLVTQAENMRNQRLRSDSTSGLKGAHWNKAAKRWSSEIRTKERRIFLGLFDTAEAAHQAYCQASAELHGEFGRTA